MSHHRSAGYLAATVALCLMAAISPAGAQGFFESLFGSSTPTPTAPRAAQRQPALIHPPQPYRQSITPSPEPRAKSHESSAASDQGSGSYRTLCVRTCDGYYWPINQTAARGNFHREAKLCQASCSSEAKLFFHPNSSPDVDTMVDLTGRAYARLPNAFKYRKALVGGCQCKSAPWTEVEMERHRHYAALDAKAAAKTIALPNAVTPPNNNQGIQVIAGAGTPKTAPASPPAADPIAQSAAVSEPAPTPVATPHPQLIDKPRSQTPVKSAAVVRKSPEPVIKPERTRTAQPPTRAPIVVRTAGKLKTPASSGPFGLGASALKWPGE